ncbi:unnamed protein product [Nippostrongylus brasiliensis]|uniref:39S ribosomal protein L13, mitochondrial n=1 Tax=Nippostrongylus brasiliensis TaxID=27835 RepID=A0A0N4YSM9_NIPBR|nr:unnamed protein product [Nippostrongylus brasiliensis]
MYHHLKRSGRRAVLQKWIPHALIAAQKRQRVVICQNHHNRFRATSWLSLILLEDEKWCTYNNTTQVIQWLPKHVKPERIQKPAPHVKNILLSFWFTSRGVAHYSPLPNGQAITAGFFTEDVLEMKRELLEKYRKFGTGCW